MKTLIKSLKFGGYKAFNEEVKINFETKKSLYNHKESIRKIEIAKDNVFEYNNHIGFIGPNSSGKTSVLNILKIYKMFVESGLRFFADNFVNNSLDVQNMNKWLLRNEDFNQNSKYFSLNIELINKEIEIRHKIKIKNTYHFSEEIYVNSIKNKNATWTQIFKKDFSDDLDFQTYSQIYSFKSKNLSLNEDDKEIVNKVYNILKEFVAGITWINSLNTINSWSTDLQNYLSKNINNQNEISKIEDFICTIANSVDNNIEKVQIEKVITNIPILHFEFKFILNNGKVISHYALSDGTWKLIGLFVRLFLLNKHKKQSIYFLFDEIDNSWHPNLTRLFLRMIKNNLFPNIVFVITFHNPYIAEEIRQDSLFLVNSNHEIKNWPDQIKEFNSENGDRSIRLEHNFSNKYLDEIVCSGPENFKPELIFDFFEE